MSQDPADEAETAELERRKNDSRWSENREDEIAERWRKATPGPWRLGRLYGGYIPVLGGSMAGEWKDADGVAIEHAPDDIDWLVKAVRAARAYFGAAAYEQVDKATALRNALRDTNHNK